MQAGRLFVFDFIPDRRFWNSETKFVDFIYDVLAIPWAGYYNVYLGASRPKVNAVFKEEWMELICLPK